MLELKREEFDTKFVLVNNSTDILMALRQIAIRVDYESFESHTSTWPLPDFIYLPALFVPRVYAREQIYSEEIGSTNLYRNISCNWKEAPRGSV